MTDKLQRPESFEFALDFLGDPEASELRAYIEQLEARAAIAADRARYSHHPAPPADGEVGELVALIREAIRAWVAWEEGAVMLNNMTEVQLTRAADLLERLAAPPAEGVNHV